MVSQKDLLLRFLFAFLGRGFFCNGFLFYRLLFVWLRSDFLLNCSLGRLCFFLGCFLLGYLLFGCFFLGCLLFC